MKLIKVWICGSCFKRYLKKITRCPKCKGKNIHTEFFQRSIPT